jgi:hypothetical protein
VVKQGIKLDVERIFEAGRIGSLIVLVADRQIRNSGTPELAFRLERELDAPMCPLLRSLGTFIDRVSAG